MVTNGIKRMTQTIVYYLIVLNIVTFFVYGIDKWKAVSQRGQSQTRLCSAERKQARTKSKAKRAKWRIREAALLGLAVLGGSIGALLGMKVWHHKRCIREGPAMLIISWEGTSSSMDFH